METLYLVSPFSHPVFVLYWGSCGLKPKFMYPHITNNTEPKSKQTTTFLKRNAPGSLPCPTPAKLMLDTISRFVPRWCFCILSASRQLHRAFNRVHRVHLELFCATRVRVPNFDRPIFPRSQIIHVISLYCGERTVYLVWFDCDVLQCY